MTETGGKILQPHSTPSLTPSEFETYLRIAREQKVDAFKLGDLAVQFAPAPVTESPSTEPDKKTAAGWKRGPDLDADPELDTTWD